MTDDHSSRDPRAAVTGRAYASVQDSASLAALERTGSLESPPEATFDRITRLASAALRTQVALLSLVTADGQLLKSQRGLEGPAGLACETPLSRLLCDQVVTSERPLLVEDMREHELTSGSRAIEGLEEIAYAAVPLRDRRDHVLGALCVISSVPRRWSAEDVNTLNEFAELVMAELDLHRAAAEATERAAAIEGLASIVDASQDAIIGKTLDGTITNWNGAAERIYGYSAEEAIGRSITILASRPEQVAEFDEIHARLARGERIEHFETVRRRRDGSIVEVSVAIAPIHDAEGRVIGASTVATDISERRESERQHQALSQLLAEAQELAGLGSWEIHLDEGCWTWTDQIHAIFGLGADEVKHGDFSRFHELIHPEDMDRYLAMFERVQNTGTPDELQFRIIRRDGAVRILHTRARLLEGDQGRKLVGTVMDVTDTRALERELGAARDRFASVLDAATETAIIGTDPSGLITVFNRGAERMLGHLAEDVICRETAALYHDPEEIAARAAELGVPASIGVLVRGARAGKPETREWTYVRKDGSKLTVSLSLTALRDAAGEITGFLGVAQDVSEARAAELAQRRAERRFSAAFLHAPIGVALTALDGPRRGCFLQTNAALARIVGREPGELDGVKIETITNPHDHDTTADVFSRLDAGETATAEMRYLHRDGHKIWVSISATPVPGEDGEAPEYCVTQVVDISERKRFEGQLRHLADHDALTGLYNRHRFGAELERVLGEARRYGRHGALLMLDLDGLKHVNDRFGHSVGDEVVTRVAGLLRGTVRETDIVARLGGDEFAIILHETDSAGAMAVCDKILEAVRRAGVVMQELRHARITTSIGITIFDGECELTGEELVVEADIAMYDAKAAGRDRHVLFGRESNRRELVSKRHSWLDRLRDAIEQDLFVLHAQPIAQICGAGVPRYELLLRMIDDSGDLIPPGAFLYNAERFDLMGAIDRWVLKNAVKLLHDHQRAGNDISLAVNLSGKTMNDVGLPADLAAMLEAHPIPDGRLVIEVTETAAIVNIDRARQLARELRALGCHFALDDFGAGFASFYYLKHLDFDYLKIDGEFIKGLVENQTDQLVVRAIVEIAQGLGTKTVAEFVGDDATVELLQKLGVDYGQGYHLGRPQAVDVVLPPLAGAQAATDLTGVAAN